MSYSCLDAQMSIHMSVQMSIHMSAHTFCIFRSINAVLVALADGELRVYNEKNLVSSLKAAF